MLLCYIIHILSLSGFRVSLCQLYNGGSVFVAINTIQFARLARSLPYTIGQNGIYDVAVQGGGANGMAIARELASRGASVVVVDKTDPNRATNRSSSYAHGGLRYLEHFEFGLVKEARQEVDRLLVTAKNLVRPLSFVLPVYKDDPHCSWLISGALTVYDWFCRNSGLPKHQWFNKTEAHKQVPGLRDLPDNPLRGAFRYYDAQILTPERWVIESMQDARQMATPQKPVDVLLHTTVTRSEETPHEVRLKVRDNLDGRGMQVRAKYLVNATGHQVDEAINTRESQSNPKQPLMGPTKGTHIFAPNKIGLRHTLYVRAPQDKRPYFITPYPDPNPTLLMIGTTDDKTWTSPYPTAKEVGYLVEATNHFLPNLSLSKDEVITAYAGFRPLPRSDKKSGAVTRKHIIRHVGNSRVFDVIGGKLTTQRSLAEELVSQMAPALGLPKQSPTRQRPLPGSVGMVGSIEAYKQSVLRQPGLHGGLSKEVIAGLVDMYGVRYQQVVQLAQMNPLLKQPLTKDAPMILAQVAYAINHEGAETLTDILARSLSTDILPNRGVDAVEPALQLLAKTKSLTDHEAKQERQQYLQYLAQNQQWRQESP